MLKEGKEEKVWTRERKQGGKKGGHGKKVKKKEERGEKAKSLKVLPN